MRVTEWVSHGWSRSRSSITGRTPTRSVPRVEYKMSIEADLANAPDGTTTQTSEFPVRFTPGVAEVRTSRRIGSSQSRLDTAWQIVIPS
jgi:hypothetical protein